MMKLYPVLALLNFARCSDPTPPPPDSVITAFYEQLQTATWLLEYNRAATIAWQQFIQTASTMQQQPGFTWFGWKEKGNWQFVFGYVHNGEFGVKQHYIIDPLLHLQSDNKKYDQTFTHPLMRSIILSPLELKPFNLPDGYMLDYFVRREADQRLHVWAITSLQDDSTGKECRGFYIVYDRTGSEVIRKGEFPIANHIITDPAGTLHILCTGVKETPLTAIYYALKYSKQFRKIEIQTDVMTSVLEAGANGKWIHIPAKH